MSKIKPVELDDDIFDNFKESSEKDSKSKKKKKKKRKEKKKKKNKYKKKHNKKKQKKKQKKQKQVQGFVPSINDVADELYSYQLNKRLSTRLLDKINIDSAIDISIGDEAVASLIGAGIVLTKGLINLFKK